MIGFAGEYLERALRRGRLSHAYLLIGPRGSGRLAFAMELSRRIFCERQDPSGSCETCASCRTIAHGNHAGVTVYETSESGGVVGIETIRDLCERSHYARDHAFIAILPHAETMTEAAANALLKTLEEPGGEFILVLLSTSEGALLPTIVSRCHRLHLPARPPALEEGVDARELDAVTRGDFWAQCDIRSWLERVVPDGASIRDRVGRIVDHLIASSRERLALGDFAPAETLLELRANLDGNANPDLVLERVIALSRSPREN